MKISDLITRLEAIKAEHGDVPVFHNDDWDWFAVETVTYSPGRIERSDDGYPAPACVGLEGNSLLVWHYPEEDTPDHRRQLAEDIGTEREQDPPERIVRHAP